MPKPKIPVRLVGMPNCPKCAADYSAWHAQGAVLALVFIVVLTVYGAWAAMGGKSNGARSST